jgi:hypothetical protein
MSSETSARETALNAPAAVERMPSRLGTLISRYWAQAAVLATAVLLWAPRLSGPIDLRWDAATYYVLGTSLATGQGYRILSEPGSPEALQYPPLLPAIVAVCQRALGSTDPAVVAPWLRILYAVLFLGYALAALALAKRYLRPLFAVTAVAFSLLQPNTIFVSDLLHTEIPFALISVLFVLVAVDGPFSSRDGCSHRPVAGQGREQNGPQGRGYRACRPWVREAASFALATAGFLLRTVGLALLVAWVLEALVRRRWRLALARGFLALLPIIAWQTYVLRVSRSDEYAHPAYAYQRAPYQYYNVSYLDSIELIDRSHPDWQHLRLSVIANSLRKNTRPLLESFGEAISTSQRVPTLVFSAIAVLGLAMLVRRRAWMMLLIVVVSAAMIWLWPWPNQFYRYLVPLTPFLMIGVMAMFDDLCALLSRLPMRPAVATVGQIELAALVAFVLVLQMSSAWKLFYDRAVQGASYVPGRGDVGPRFFYYSKFSRGWDVAIAWIQSHSDPNAIVVTHLPQLCYLRTGRRAVLPPVDRNQDRIRELLESVPASYVILDPIDRMPVVENDNQRWRSVQSVNRVRLYERISGTE